MKWLIDDLSTGVIENIKEYKGNKNFTFIRGSITSQESVNKALDDVTAVYHFAAQSDVRQSMNDPMKDFRINVVGGMILLDSMRKYDVKRMVFASSGGTVYGDRKVLPTPESTLLEPISNYGAAKCAFEMYLSSYSTLYDMSAVSLRFANIIGPRLTHGVIFDLFMKLKQNPTKLAVFGSGKQEKSYLDISDAIEAVFLLQKQLSAGYLPVNISSRERLTVSKIVEIIREGLNLKDLEVQYTGGERGWPGDVPATDLDIGLLRSLGWEPKVQIESGVQQYLKWLVATYGTIR